MAKKDEEAGSGVFVGDVCLCVTGTNFAIWNPNSPYRNPVPIFAICLRFHQLSASFSDLLMFAELLKLTLSCYFLLLLSSVCAIDRFSSIERNPA